VGGTNHHLPTGMYAAFIFKLHPHINFFNSNINLN